jgi:hypothetical protein
MMYCGTRLLGVRPLRGQFWPTALSISILAAIIRGLPIPFGLGTALVFLTYSLIAAKVLRLSCRTALLVAGIGFFHLVMGEALVLAPVLTAKQMTVDQARATLTGTLLYGYLSLSVLILVSLLTYFFKIRLFSVPEAQPPAAPAGQREARG